MSGTLDLSFHFRFKYSTANPRSLRQVIVFRGIITLESLNSLVNSNLGVPTGEYLIYGVFIVFTVKQD